MFSASNETLMSLAKAARLEAVHPGTIYRWHRPGLRGGRIRLELRRRGGRLMVSVEALARFYRALELDADEAATRATTTAHDEAARACEAAGI